MVSDDLSSLKSPDFFWWRQVVNHYLTDNEGNDFINAEALVMRQDFSDKILTLDGFLIAAPDYPHLNDVCILFVR